MTDVDKHDHRRPPDDLTSLEEALAWCGRRIASALLQQAEAAGVVTPAEEPRQL